MTSDNGEVQRVGKNLETVNTHMLTVWCIHRLALCVCGVTAKLYSFWWQTWGWRFTRQTPTQRKLRQIQINTEADAKFEGSSVICVTVQTKHMDREWLRLCCHIRKWKWKHYTQAQAQAHYWRSQGRPQSSNTHIIFTSSDGIKASGCVIWGMLVSVCPVHLFLALLHT